MLDGMPRKRDSAALFDGCFAYGTALYVALFAFCVYAHTASPLAKMGVSLLVCALPALLATELGGGDEDRGAHLARLWLQEFVGTAVMVALTCAPGAFCGHLGRTYEWPAHFVAMVVADWACGGPHVNPCVTLAFLVGDGGRWADAAVRALAQTGGAVVGWRVLLGAGPRLLAGAVGGPAPDPDVGVAALAWSEALGSFALVAAVWAFGTTRAFEGRGYLAKMALINAVLRAVIENHGATGPAVNPALASGYVFATTGAWPALASDHVRAYWVGALGGAAAMGAVWRFVKARGAATWVGDAAKVGLGVYFCGLALALWKLHLGKDAADVARAARFGRAMAKRHPVSKLLRRKPAGWK